MSNVPQKKIPLQSILDAKVDYLSGMTIKEVSSKHKISVSVLKDRFSRIDEISESNLPALSMERKIISDALSNHLKPIKEELSMASYEIVKAADSLVLERILNEPEDVSTKDLLRASDSHSQRLARITGMEEDPLAGKPKDPARANIMIQNIFNRILPKNVVNEENNPETIDIVSE